MIIEPSNENLFIAQLLECIILLVLLLEYDDFRMLFKVDVVGEVNLIYMYKYVDQLPNKTQHNMLSLLHDELRSQIDDSASDGLRR